MLCFTYTHSRVGLLKYVFVCMHVLLSLPILCYCFPYPCVTVHSLCVLSHCLYVCVNTCDYANLFDNAWPKDACLNAES